MFKVNSHDSDLHELLRNILFLWRWIENATMFKWSKWRPKARRVAFLTSLLSCCRAFHMIFHIDKTFSSKSPTQPGMKSWRFKQVISQRNSTRILKHFRRDLGSRRQMLIWGGCTITETKRKVCGFHYHSQKVSINISCLDIENRKDILYRRNILHIYIYTVYKEPFNQIMKSTRAGHWFVSQGQICFLGLNWWSFIMLIETWKSHEVTKIHRWFENSLHVDIKTASMLSWLKSSLFRLIFRFEVLDYTITTVCSPSSKGTL